MKATTLICLLGLAALATAEEKVTGYHSASAAVLAKSGKILISTVLTPEVEEAQEILPVPQPPIIEDHENSIQPIQPLPVVSPPVAPIGVLPVIQPLPVVSPPVAPVIQPLPVVSPPVSGGQPAPLPAEGGNLIPDVIVTEKPSFGLFPIVEDNQNSILPVVEVGHKLPVVDQPQPVIQPLPVVSPPVSGGQPVPLPAEGGNLIPDDIAPEKPSFGLFPIVEDDNQNSILPVVEVGHKLPVVDQPQPVIQPLPVVSPPVSGGQPVPLPAEGGNLIPDSIIGKPVALPAEGGNLIPDDLGQPAVAILPIQEEIPVRPKPVYFPENGIIF